MTTTPITSINVSFLSNGDKPHFDIVIWRGEQHPRANTVINRGLNSHHACYWNPTMSSVKRAQRVQIEIARRMNGETK